MGNDKEQGRAADAVVIGGGVIGLSIARELSAAGLQTTLIERGELGRGASFAAGGMLAPQAEADAPDAFFRLTHESRRIYPAFAAELLEETGVDVELDETGILYLAFTDQETAELARRFAWQSEAGLAIERSTPEEARRREPHLSPDVRAALFFPHDGQVENRLLTFALAASCARRGVEILTNTEVITLETERGEMTGDTPGDDFAGEHVRRVVTSRGRITTNLVVVASGAWASCLAVNAAPPACNFTIEPVRGQMLCFDSAPPLVCHVIYSPRAYLIPRRDGRLLVGATTEHAGFDAHVTARGLHLLTAGALEITARMSEVTFRDAWAGLRPRTPDGLPVIGRAPRIANLIYATGHYRNGILLAPLTARLVRELVTAPHATPELLRAFSPARFDKPRVRGT